MEMAVHVWWMRLEWEGLAPSKPRNLGAVINIDFSVAEHGSSHLPYSLAKAARHTTMVGVGGVPIGCS